jgi:hypothetical protein
MNTIAQPRSVKRTSLMIVGLILILTIGIGIFVHLVSPLRDPAFEPNSANAGSLLPWMGTISESDWILGLNLFAMVIASSLTVLTKLLSTVRNFKSSDLTQWTIGQVLQVEYWFAIGSAAWIIFNLAFISYLLYWGLYFVAIFVTCCLAGLIGLLSTVRNFRSPNPNKRTIGKVLHVGYWFTIGMDLYFTLTLGFFVYLLQQWIID